MGSGWGAEADPLRPVGSESGPPSRSVPPLLARMPPLHARTRRFVASALAVLVATRSLASASAASDALESLAASPTVPRELRPRLAAARRELVAAGLAPLASAALERGGGAASAARDLALASDAAHAACGSERGTWAMDDAPPAATKTPSPARGERLAPNNATARSAAANASALFSALAHAIAARDADPARGLAALADETREYAAVLGALSNQRGADAAKKDANDAGCFRLGGFVARSLASRDALDLPFDALVARAKAWSDAEVGKCAPARTLAAAFAAAAPGVEAFFVQTAAVAVEWCRAAGAGSGVTRPDAAAAEKIRAFRAHQAALARTLREALEDGACQDIPLSETTTLGDLSPPSKNRLGDLLGDVLQRDPEISDRGAEISALATGASILAFLASASEDVLLTDRGCARVRDAPRGTFYPSPAFDALAQEAASCGLDDRERRWVAGTFGANGGSSRMADAFDEARDRARIVDADAEEGCASSPGSTSENLPPAEKNAAVHHAEGAARKGTDPPPPPPPPPPPLRAAELFAAAAHFRGLAAATEGCRFGRRVEYAPARRLAEALEAYATSADACDGKKPETEKNRVEKTSASLVAAPASLEDVADLAASDGGSESSSSFGRRRAAVPPGVVAVAAALGVASAAGALACFERRRRNKRSALAASARRPPSSSSDGGNGGGRRRASDDESDRARLVGSDALGSARRFYRHLEAGSAGDLPLVEDLDKREKETASARADVVAPLGAFFQPAERRRSHSISGPATSARPPLARPRSTKAPGSSSGGSSRVGDDEEARQE